MMQLQKTTAEPLPEPVIISSTARLEAMLGEMNHRVANSLQLVSAMVSIEARGVADPAAREALQATQRRIEAVARVHSRLYRSDGADRVDLADYLTDLAKQLADSHERPVTVQAASVDVPVDRAISVGVICSELVSNACKYAYRPDEPGGITVTLSATANGGYHVAVEDRGSGFPADGRIRGTGMGRQLVDVMARSLGARGGYEPLAIGTRYVLTGR